MFLGIDLGTSEVKVLLLNDQQCVVGVAAHPVAISRPHPQWSEQDPESWWVATQAAIADLKARYATEFAQIRGIGYSGQMHGAVLLGENNQVLRPAILWNDARCGQECEELQAREPRVFDITGNLVMPGFTAPKLVWVEKHEPEIFAKTKLVLLPKDYLRLKMTGEAVSEMSDAAGTLWLDVGKRDWSDAMLAATHLSRAQMPRLVEGSEVSGVLLPELVSAWGLSGRVVVAGGAGDNAASAIGIGAVGNGNGFLSLGTSGVLFVCNDQFRPNPKSGVHAFCHCLPNEWHQMSVILSAASALRWATKLTHAKNELELLGEIDQMSAGQKAQAPIFLPYLSGERTPHNDPFAQGVLFGMTHDTDRAALGYAVLEGVAFAMADGHAALQAAGTALKNISLVGGGARSPYWATLLSSVMNHPLSTHVGGEVGAALGAARLGWLATGEVDSTTLCVAPPIANTFTPDAEIRAMMLPRYAKYKNLYPDLAARFRDVQ